MLAFTMIFLRKLSLISFILLFSQSISANEKTIKIGAFLIPQMIHSDKEGVFIDLVKEVAKRSNIKIKILIYPPIRALKSYLDGKIHGYFPALDVRLPKPSNKTSNFYAKRDFIFFHKDKPKRGLADLEGQRVGLTFGYAYPKSLSSNKNIEKFFVSSDDQNVKKLELKRIDAFVVEEMSGLSAIKRTGVKDVTYNPKAVLHAHDVYFAFEKTDLGAKVTKKFTQVIESMKKDGTLKNILQPTKNYRFIK
jgi:polar amino acid transport system substrate-binding protein